MCGITPSQTLLRPARALFSLSEKQMSEAMKADVFGWMHIQRYMGTLKATICWVSSCQECPARTCGSWGCSIHISQRRFNLKWGYTMLYSTYPKIIGWFDMVWSYSNHHFKGYFGVPAWANIFHIPTLCASWSPCFLDTTSVNGMPRTQTRWSLDLSYHPASKCIKKLHPTLVEINPGQHTSHVAIVS
jgi:hypothetical protein